MQPLNYYRGNSCRSLFLVMLFLLSAQSLLAGTIFKRNDRSDFITINETYIDNEFEVQLFFSNKMYKSYTIGYFEGLDITIKENSDYIKRRNFLNNTTYLSGTYGPQELFPLSRRHKEYYKDRDSSFIDSAVSTVFDVLFLPIRLSAKTMRNIAVNNDLKILKKIIKEKNFERNFSEKRFYRFVSYLNFGTDWARD